ncbi:hypothetical protein Nmel_013826 [Mimus melanotis]
MLTSRADLCLLHLQELCRHPNIRGFSDPVNQKRLSEYKNQCSDVDPFCAKSQLLELQQRCPIVATDVEKNTKK